MVVDVIRALTTLLLLLLVPPLLLPQEHPLTRRERTGQTCVSSYLLGPFLSPPINDIQLYPSHGVIGPFQPAE